MSYCLVDGLIDWLCFDGWLFDCVEPVDGFFFKKVSVEPSLKCYYFTVPEEADRQLDIKERQETLARKVSDSDSARDWEEENKECFWHCQGEICRWR